MVGFAVAEAEVKACLEDGVGDGGAVDADPGGGSLVGFWAVEGYLGDGEGGGDGGVGVIVGWGGVEDRAGPVVAVLS